MRGHTDHFGGEAWEPANDPAIPPHIEPPVKYPTAAATNPPIIAPARLPNQLEPPAYLIISAI